MTNAADKLATTPHISHAVELPLTCADPSSGQSLNFTQIDGQQIITYSYPAHERANQITLTAVESAEIMAWRNGGRRNSYWNWPGWDAVRERDERGAVKAPPKKLNRRTIA